MQKGVVKKRRTRPLSEFGVQLKEKQALKGQYSLRERAFKRYVTGVLAARGTANSAERLVQKLEMRLDSVVLRMGFGDTHKQAKQIVSHGHMLVNGRRVTIPSYAVQRGDVISLRPSSHGKKLFQNIKLGLKKYQSPSWIRLDKDALQAEVVGEPTLQEIAPAAEIPLIFEFYSR